MSDPQDPGLIATMHSLLGGAVTSLIAAATGRAMYHAGEVRARRRPILSWDLAWEMPLAVGMALIGDGLSAYWHLDEPVGVALIAILSYLGPRGAGAFLERWFNRKD